MQNFRKFLSLVSGLMLFAMIPIHAQNDGSISVSLKNSTIVDALKAIEKQSGLSINFSDSQLKGKVLSNLELRDATLAQALDEVLKNTGFQYNVKGSYVIISEGRNEAENRTISGIVKDESGYPLTGVVISVKGTSVGTVTDLDGKFSLKVPANSTLVASCMGYKDYVVNTASGDVFDIALAVDNELLDEVVVTALGIKRSEKALSYNVQKFDGGELTAIKDANFINSLNGKIAGVNINRSASGVGGASRVILRGAKSLEGNNNALYVVDGIPLFNTTMGQDSGIMGEGRASTEGIADFNPEDIESISVLSGPSAAALYGSSAANGVILITTKKGKEGKLQVSFSSSTEFTRAYMTPEFQNTYGNKTEMYESWGDKLATPSTYNPKKDFFQTGHNLVNSFTLTTGTKRNQTFASASATNSIGIVPNNTYDRYNFTIRNTSTFFNDKIHLDLGASYIKQLDRNMVSQGQYWNPVMAAYLFPRGESFEDIKTFERFDDSRKLAVQHWPVSDPVYASQNPYWTAYRNVAENNKDRYMFNVGLTYDILDWLNVSVRYRMDNTHLSFERKIYASSDQKFAEGTKGHYGYSNYKDHQEYADAMLNINKAFGDFSLMANVGWNYSYYWALERGYKGTLLGVPNKFAASNIDPSNGRVSESGGDSRVRNHALFANLEFGWKNMLFLTLTGRNDWNSRLVNTAEESFFYPSVGLSAVISEMFKDRPEFLSYLKVRGSYTEVGAPVSRSGLTPGTVTTPIVGGALSPTGIYPFTDFKAERTRSYEFGMNMRLWNSLRLDLTYYHSNTYNQTFLGSLPEFTGYKQIYLQAGNVQNSGWEVALGYDNTFTNGLDVSSTVTFSRNVNVIKEMVNNYKTDLMETPINIPEVLKDGGRVILKEGGSIHDIYATTFLKKDHQGYVEVKEDGTYGLERGEPVYLGKTSPDFNLGWSNSLSFKGFSLSFLINGRFGGVVTSSTEAILDRFGVSKRSGDDRDAGGVMLKGQGRTDAKTFYQMVGTGGYETSGYYVYSATNIRLQEVAISYTMPNKWFNDVLKDLTLSVIANNPVMIYCKAPFDPELTPSTGTYGQGNDYFMQPSVRGFGFAVKFKF